MKKEMTQEYMFLKHYICHTIPISTYNPNSIINNFLDSIEQAKNIDDIILIKNNLFIKFFEQKNIKDSLFYNGEKKTLKQLYKAYDMLSEHTIITLEKIDKIYKKNINFNNTIQNKILFKNEPLLTGNDDETKKLIYFLCEKYNIQDIIFEQGINTYRRKEIIIEITSYLQDIYKLLNIEKPAIDEFSLHFHVDGYYNNFYNNRKKEIHLTQDITYAFIHEWLHHIDHTKGKKIKDSLFNKKVLLQDFSKLSDCKTLFPLFSNHKLKENPKELKILKNIEHLIQKAKNFKYQKIKEKDLEYQKYKTSPSETFIVLIESWLYHQLYIHKINFTHIYSNDYPTKEELVEIDNEIFQLWNDIKTIK